MRTLKKSLALVLALVMVLGLGVVGASADNKLDDYTDAKDIGEAYVEAVGVMTGLEIVDGMTETTIDPTATYTREQAAKIIAYMVLGKTAADSLTCTVAPFDDVAADRWSAGYISFCVEQGIIDGMTDTTFEPTGTLTGFQWAKMLLSAVGFNAKGEFTGDSWSLNTARVAHSVGLFSGDAAGADHVALQRQQAMLYAFNTLTKVDCVVWSEALGDYIERYNIFADRYTYQGTLGWNVFALRSATGIITTNEGIGNTAGAVLYNNYTSTGNPLATVKGTGTDVYDIWHAARIWYTDSDKDLDTNVGNSVYVNDLSKVTSYDCHDIAEGEKAFDKLTASQQKLKNGVLGGNGTAYEYDLIDNTAAGSEYGYAEVTFNYSMSKLGPRSEVNDTVVPYTGANAVSNDKVWTDISKIDRGDGIVYLVQGGIFYIYPTSVTTAAVDKITSTGIITLTDGTQLKPSAFIDGAKLTTAVAEIRTAIADPSINTPKYAFLLDSHGHWYDKDVNSLRTVAYFTGDLRPTSASNAWSHDVTFDALFARVSNGEIVAVPVTNKWVSEHAYNLDNTHEGYYDITDELNGNATYAPYKIDTSKAYGYYNFKNEFEVKSGTFTIEATDGTDYIFNPATVQYYVAEGYGQGLKVTPYTGNDALIKAFNTNGSIDTVTLKDVAVLTTSTEASNRAVTVIFGYNGVKSTSGGMLFLPHGLNSNSWETAGNSWISYTDDVYLNGVELNSDDNIILVNKTTFDTGFNYVPGFYRYTMDKNGFVTELTKVENQHSVTHTGALQAAPGNFYVLDSKRLSDSVVVCDVRTGIEKQYDGITAVADFFSNYADPPVQLSLIYLTNSSNQITCIYVVDANTYKVELKADNVWNGCEVVADKNEFNVGTTGKVVITITNPSGHSNDAFYVPVTVGTTTTNYQFNTTPSNRVNGNTLTITVEVETACTITVGAYVMGTAPTA